MIDIATVARRNRVYKISAFVLAILLWVYVQAEQQGVQVLTIPLDVEGLEVGYVVEPEPPKVVELRVKGPKGTLANLSSRDFRARVSLSGAKPGSLVAGIQVDSPPTVQIIGRTPPELNLTVDILENRSVPVSYEFKGLAPAGYKVGEPTFRPTEVLISGPRERVQSIQKVAVQIPLGTKETFVRNLPVRILDPALKANEDSNLRISPKSIEVTVPILEELPAKSVGIQPQITGVPPKGYRVVSTKVEPSNVVISGPADILRDINFVATSPIDITDARSNIVRDVPLLFPSGVRSQGSNRVRITVVIEALNGKDIPKDETKPASGGQSLPDPTKDPNKPDSGLNRPGSNITPGGSGTSGGSGGAGGQNGSGSAGASGSGTGTSGGKPN